MVAITPFILFPLYLWPGQNSWQPLYDQIDAYPKVNFNIIINPNSGPGTVGSPAPDQNWIDTIAKLNSKPNTQLLGYVHVLWGDREATLVKDEIATYATWSNYKDSDIALDGIFFDEAPAVSNATLIEYMKTMSDYARSQINSTAKRIVFNPGTAVADEYYAYADTIVGFENYYANYQNNVNAYPMAALRTTSKPKSAFIIHSFTGTAADQEQIVSSMMQNDIPGIYISTSDSYDKFSTLWPQLVAQINAANQGLEDYNHKTYNHKNYNHKDYNHKIYNHYHKIYDHYHEIYYHEDYDDETYNDKNYNHETNHDEDNHDENYNNKDDHYDEHYNEEDNHYSCLEAGRKEGGI